MYFFQAQHATAKPDRVQLVVVSDSYLVYKIRGYVMSDI